MTIHTNWDNVTLRRMVAFELERSDYQDLYMRPRIQELMKLINELIDYIETETIPVEEF